MCTSSPSQKLTFSSGLIDFVSCNLGEAGNKSVSLVRFLTAAVTEGNSDDSSDSEFGDLNTDSINDVLEDLRVDTTCLLDLEPLLCNPILQTDPEPTAVLDATRITWCPHQPYSDKVSVRFPMATDVLVNRLGKANYGRYLRCQEQKAINELGDIQPDQIASGGLDSASSRFHDSGIGSSLPTTSSAYAETVMSYGMGEGRKVRVPPLPNQAKEGLPFSCVACGKLVKIATNSAWKKHIYGDLQPWLCVEANCIFASDTFPTRADWISHLALHHKMEPEWGMIECPLCRGVIGPGKILITKHLGDHLEEVSLAALPADCEPDDKNSDASTDDPTDDFNQRRELDDDTRAFILDETNSLYPGRDITQSPIKMEGDHADETKEYKAYHWNDVQATGKGTESSPSLRGAEISNIIEDAESPPCLQCSICQWAPDTKVRRSQRKLKMAMEKHMKRNHQSRGYSCPICNQGFRNRPDNVKQHIRRKHPESFDSLYPKETVVGPSRAREASAQEVLKTKASGLGDVSETSPLPAQGE